MNISFIGFGHMAKAIAQGLQHQADHLNAASPSLSIGLTPEGIRTHYDNKAIISYANVIILAVKPKQMADVLTNIQTCIPNNCLVISVAAGISLSWLEKNLPSQTAIIRAMPNIAASTGQSATPLIANQWADTEQKHTAERIFKCIGLITWAQQEKDIDIFTALSGSGPAYVFLFMDALIQAATHLGLKEDIAKSFTLQTVKGAVELALTQTKSLTELRETVTSPAGTTAAALQVLLKNNFEDILLDAVQAAHKRAYELGKETS
jgi:pyrroline-5-carboxylate reductase